MTWNKSEGELRELLDEATTWHPNIKLDYQIGQSLPFLDVFLINQNGILSTSTYLITSQVLNLTFYHSSLTILDMSL
jgi:hypothetical protein